MTKRKLAAEICKREGKKSQAHIGDVMEILTIIEEITAENLYNEGVVGITGDEEEYPFHYLVNGTQKKLDKLWNKAKGKR